MIRLGRSADHYAAEVVRAVNRVLDFFLMIGVVAVILTSIYSVWDSNVIYTDAAPQQFEVYRPTTEDTVSFEELQKMNGDVFAWLTVYGTNINYPVVQGKDNRVYLNKDPEGRYALSGSVFLDFRGHKDLLSFNNILYGHHMSEGMMFGDIDRYLEKGFLEKHLYGTIFHDKKEEGLEIFAVLKGDAADQTLFSPPLEDDELKEAFLKKVRKDAVFLREAGVTTDDRLLILSTCATGKRTDRNFLIAKITKEVMPDPFPKKEAPKRKTAVHNSGTTGELFQVPVPVWGTLLLLILLSVLLLLVRYFRMRRRRKDALGAAFVKAGKRGRRGRSRRNPEGTMEGTKERREAKERSPDGEEEDEIAFYQISDKGWVRHPQDADRKATGDT
jgi:sortase B